MNEKKLKEAFKRIKIDIASLTQEIQKLRQELAELKQNLQPNMIPAHLLHPAHNPAHNFQNYDLFRQNFQSSTGNEGVPTDRQQTDNRQTNMAFSSKIVAQFRKELKEKFSSLTKQQFLVFSMLYMLEEELGRVSYRELAQRLGLTESSVRDYISQLQHKGIPILKEKVNNKVVVLKIDKCFKDLTNLKNLERIQFG